MSAGSESVYRALREAVTRVELPVLVRRYGWLALATGGVAAYTIRAILVENDGLPAAALDDAYIHFQFARSFAELRPFVYSEGAPPVAGATSILWPLLLAPFIAAGLTGAHLIYVAWAFGFVSLGLLAWECFRQAHALFGSLVALAVAGSVLVFGGHVWCAASGMEVIPFAYLLARTARRSAEWWESEGDVDRGTRIELCVLALLAPLMRPEGVLASLGIALTLALRPRGARRTWAGLPLLSAIAPQLVNYAFTGRFSSTTSQVKWLATNPYYDAGEFVAAVATNARLLFDTLLNGEQWAAASLPQGGRWIALAALPALLYVGYTRRQLPRAVATLLLALGILIPTTYDSFLWNRLRYLWPFASGWLIAVGALSEVIGDLAARVRPRYVELRVLFAGAIFGSLLEHSSIAVRDVAVSAHAIDAQQVALAQWAKTALPANSRIGVNDTGAIAYYSGHETFDVVGLTTPGEARFWVAGAGSRFEHYEKMPRSTLPTHFIVYPEWFGIPPLLGEVLAERSVSATILGGARKVAYRADYSSLGSAELPTLAAFAQRSPIDSLDVADLESEAGHDYVLHDAAQYLNLAFEHEDRVDGGRDQRHQETFTLQLAPGGSLVMRLVASTATRIEISLDGEALAAASLAASDWQEVAFEVPARATSGVHRIDVRAWPRIAVLHYWSFAPTAP